MAQLFSPVINAGGRQNVLYTSTTSKTPPVAATPPDAATSQLASVQILGGSGQGSRALRARSVGGSASTDDPDKLNITRTQIVVEDGSISQIIVEGIAAGQPMRFTNHIPVAISNTNDLQHMPGAKLFDAANYRNNARYIKLGNVIDYHPNLYNYTRDFSPKDASFELGNSAKPTPQTQATLYKDALDKIVKARTFTDLQGLNDASPNGLVQIEVSARLHLNDKWLQTKRSAGDYKLFSFIEPYLHLAQAGEQKPLCTRHLPFR